jgi:hypothetical protein
MGSLSAFQLANGLESLCNQVFFDLWTLLRLGNRWFLQHCEHRLGRVGVAFFFDWVTYHCFQSFFVFLKVVSWSIQLQIFRNHIEQNPFLIPLPSQ